MNLTRKSTVAYFIVSVIVYFLCMGFGAYYEKQTEYDRLSNQLYYDNILIIYNGQNIDWDRIDNSKEYRVYVEIDPNCRVLIKDTSRWTPPMLLGEYFKELKVQQAVIGKNIESSTYVNESGQKTINYIGQKFHVIGTIGTDYITSCDDLIILSGVKFESDVNNIYVLDVKTESDAEDMSRILLKKYPEIQIQRGVIRGTARITKKAYFCKLLIIETIAIITLALFIILKLRHIRYDLNIKVYYINGLSLRKIICIDLAEIMFINAITFGISAFTGYYLGVIKNNIKYQLGMFTVMMVFTIVIDLSFWIVKVLDINKHNRRKKIMKGCD